MTADEATDMLARALRNIAPEIDLSSCDTSAPMNVELELDSMDLLSLLAQLSEMTGADIPDQAISADASTDDVVAYLASR